MCLHTCWRHVCAQILESFDVFELCQAEDSKIDILEALALAELMGLAMNAEVKFTFKI